MNILAEVIKQAEILKSVITLLKKEFGCPVYADEVREDFKKPCFFIGASSSMSPQTVNYMRKELTLALTYYVKDSDKNEITYLDAVDHVQSLLQVGIQAGSRYLKIDSVEDDRVGEENDVLQIIVTIPYLERVTGARSHSTDKMEELTVDITHDGGNNNKEDFHGII